jgi:microcystin degradation protein MlrC
MHWVATPGVTTADLSTFVYRHRRQPMYPFEADTRHP